MILHALNSYYQRMQDDPDAAMPAFGTSIENISFALVLGEDGSLRDIEDLREGGGKKLKPRKLPVPAAVTRTSGVKANFIWDKAAYIFGTDGDGATTKNLERFDAFRELLTTVCGDLEDPGYQAVLRFLRSWNAEQTEGAVSRFQPWEEVCNANLVFRLDGTPGFIHDRPTVHQCWIEYGQTASDAPLGQCLISGEENAPLARVHTPIKGVRGGQKSGGYIVSYNASAFVSYKQDKASVAETSAFAYTTALNALLASDSRQKVSIGDTTYIFWAERKNIAEELFADFFAPPEEEGKSAPASRDDRQTAANIRGLLKAVRDGRRPVDFLPELDENVRFYILGLAPNAARLSIRFWATDSLGNLLTRVSRHYEQLDIVRQYDSEPEFPPLWRLLVQTATLGKGENISPVLAGGLTRAMLTGNPYPKSLLPVVLDRIRAEQDVTYFRAALLKAFLLRNTKMEEVTVSLNPERTDLPYLLGRLFAVIEKTQEEAVPGSNATVKDRYLAAASATPGLVFHLLLKNRTNHIAKLRKDPERKGRAVYLERLTQDIIAEFNDYPKTQAPEQQGLFMIGYYHQRKDFYTKKTQEG
ncbi:type I-C CRISPR-associated protein Cas8c/Csd1 [Geothermobacter hydrogeniphilus]|uniref:Type I-C CRISPR-associated protein Cas8c/Csd1 n=1 Tax=Geothermobacter hydrogeniphilus TaxID=1969733 RepID=A0A2K2HCI1_9BACT|nr:type I-C CRISPR-associated protein Cas8c/Csd1 [Geothermobacter hydrogeniphilus]PNU21022.1 type I-C CRISPR-associated protein Cas8c/Csd1 [Geothermobacter hydrogeniphilus]